MKGGNGSGERKNGEITSGERKIGEIIFRGNDFVGKYLEGNHLGVEKS